MKVRMTFSLNEETVRHLRSRECYNASAYIDALVQKALRDGIKSDNDAIQALDPNRGLSVSSVGRNTVGGVPRGGWTFETRPKSYHPPCGHLHGRYGCTNDGHCGYGEPDPEIEELLASGFLRKGEVG